MRYTNEVMKSYRLGDYRHCLHVFGNKSLGLSYLPKTTEDTAILNQITKEFILENNEALCHSIVEFERSKQTWLESLYRFTQLYSKYKSLLVIPIELEMTVIYNTLWWFWIKPNVFPTSSHHLENFWKSVSCCLIKVLKSRGEVILGEDASDDVSSVVSLLKRASDQLLCLSPVACVRLLDVITIITQVLLKEALFGTAAECLTMMSRIVHKIDVLRLHVEKGIGLTTDKEEFYFKFGFKCLNSTASLKDCTDSINAFIITSSMNCELNKEYEQSIKCLEAVSREDSSDNFLMNYLKAHCNLMSQQLIEAKLCLAYVMSGPVPPLQLAHYRLLLARLLGAQGEHQTALAQCDAVLASHPDHFRLASLAAHLASQLVNSSVRLSYLRKLVQSLKTELSQDKGHFESFEECCILTLSRQFSISLPEAVYTLARQLYLTGYHVKSLDSYKELLELVSQSAEVSPQLPHRSQITQECILAHIKSNNISGGEQLCRQLIKDHLPHSGGKCSVWEDYLYTQEDDVVTLVLLADLLVAAGNKRKALEELNRCQNALSEWREQAKCETDMQLCDWLLCRVMLRKAKISNSSDAVHYFRRSLAYKPGDKEAMFHYKQWSLWHPDHESFDPGDSSAAVTFPVDELHNLAVRYVLGCAVSEEEWNHLFNQEASQNLIESLFDDDE
ncbi:uncharacterized protein LOC128992428 [Macrosteles quadrilineatus]|uniref:uncharacterized protein LOC128992428 n=1 Tax=Macrosteles quadrilineatus TaxID=74068 RepID=UPI0023E09088|nr:uncharacterized protein LOC128992428 [Macrosteles quadrilineatus]